MSKRALMGAMFGCLGIGLVLMLGFESALTRALGVLALFAFIVIGVFLIADPDFLAAEDQQPLDD